MVDLKRMTGLNVILASTAEHRSGILDRIHIKHRMVRPRGNEPDYTGGSVTDYVEQAALFKAKSIERDFPTGLIIGADQVVTIDNEVLGKPGDPKSAMRQLARLSGKTHELICGLAIIYEGQVRIYHESCKMSMRTLSDEEISSYVKQDQPEHCAGSYKIESLGASLFEGIETNDPNAIIGLPTVLLCSALRYFGFSNLL